MNTTIPVPPKHFTLATFLIFLLVFIGGVFYVKPLWDDVSSLSLGRDEKQQQKEALSQQVKGLQDLQQSLNLASEVNKQTTLYAIPERLEQDKLIMDLTSISQKNDIVLNGINFGVVTGNTENVKRVTVNANLTGDMGGLLGFLKGIEANQRKLLVKSITVQSGESQTAMPRVNFNVSMEAYYQANI